MGYESVYCHVGGLRVDLSAGKYYRDDYQSLRQSDAWDAVKYGPIHIRMLPETLSYHNDLIHSFNDSDSRGWLSPSRLRAKILVNWSQGEVTTNNPLAS